MNDPILLIFLLVFVVIGLILSWPRRPVIRGGPRDWRWHKQPYGRTLIAFEQNGCMAHDWREIDRGEIVSVFEKVIYGSARPVLFYGVMRDDGTTFQAFADYCHEATSEMERHTGLSLVGNIVYLK